MENSALPLNRRKKPDSHFKKDRSDQVCNSIRTRNFALWVEMWLDDCQIRQHSPLTIASRRCLLNRLHTFLKEQEFEECGLAELRRFFATLDNHLTGATIRPVTVATYHRHIRTFCSWLVTRSCSKLLRWSECLPP